MDAKVAPRPGASNAGQAREVELAPLSKRPESDDAAAKDRRMKRQMSRMSVSDKVDMKRKASAVESVTIGAGASTRNVSVSKYDLDLVRTYQTRARFFMYMRYKQRFHFREHCDKLLFYVVFLTFFTASTVLNFQNRLIFTMGAATSDALLEEEFPGEITQIQKTFFDIGSAEEFYQWVENVMVPQFYTSATAFSDSDVGYMFGQNAVIGGVRIGQLRLRSTGSKCIGLSGTLKSRTGAKLNLPCWGNAGEWADEFEDKRTIARGSGGITFRHEGGGDNFLSKPGASFYSVSRVRSSPLGSGGIITNENKEYPATAYGIVYPHPNAPDAEAIAANLTKTMIEGQYLARDTRFVTIEFNLYNENVDIFGVYRLYAEFPATGGVNVGNKNNLVRMYSVLTGSSIADVIIELIVAVFFFVYFLDEVLSVLKHGTHVMLHAHNVVNKLNILFYLLMWIFRILAVSNAPDQSSVIWDADVFYPMQAAASLRSIAVSFAAMNAFLCFFRLAHYLSALPQFAVVTGTLYRSIVPCLEFLFVFGIVFLGFVTAHMLIFGQELQGYQNMRDSSYTLLLSLMGDINLESLEEVNAFWGPVFVILFTLVATFIVLNIFIAIVTEGYEDVRDELARSKRYNLREQFGWYLADRLRAIPKYGKTLDFKARYYFSTARLARRVNAQSEKLKLMLKNRGVRISESAADAGVAGTNRYGTDEDNGGHGCASHVCCSCCPEWLGGRPTHPSQHPRIPHINEQSPHGRYGLYLMLQPHGSASAGPSKRGGHTRESPQFRASNPLNAIPK